jgi:hypothetical protein
MQRLEDEDLATLRQLRVLDERTAGRVLDDDRDRAIADEALKLGRIRVANIAAELGLHRSTVWRRVYGNGGMLAMSEALHRRGATLLGEAKPQEWKVVMAMAKTLACAPGSLDLGQYNRLARMYTAGFEAHQLLFPPLGLKIRREGERVIITGPGPLPPELADAVRAGRAERIYSPPRCHSCGRFVGAAATGRPRRWCSDRCRKRYLRAR